MYSTVKPPSFYNVGIYIRLSQEDEDKALKGAISLFAESRKVSTLSSIEIYLTFFNGKYCSI